MKLKRASVGILFSMMILANCRGAGAYEFAGVDIHGFLSQGYLKSTENNFLGLSTEEGSFAFNEAAVNFSGRISQKLWIGLQLFAHDFGDVGNHDVFLDWAVGDYHWRDWLGLRFGKIKMPMGFYNTGADVDMLRTFLLLPQSVYDFRYRNLNNAILGGELYGVINLPFGGDLEYELFGGTMEMDNSSLVGDVFLQYASTAMPPGSSVSLGRLSAKMEDLVGGSFRWNTPVENFRLGLSLFTYSIATEANLIASFALTEQFPILQLTSQVPVSIDRNCDYVAVFSAEYTHGNISIVGEGFMEKDANEISILVEIPGLPSSMQMDYTYMGYYAQVSYRLFDRVELGTYYSIYYDDADDRNGDAYAAISMPRHLAWQKDLCLCARFDLTPFWSLKIEGHHMDGTALTEFVETPDQDNRYWWLFGIKTTVNF